MRRAKLMARHTSLVASRLFTLLSQSFPRPASTSDSLESDLALLAVRRGPLGADDFTKSAATEELEKDILLLLLEALGLGEEMVAELGSDAHGDEYGVVGGFVERKKKVE
jgi:hypothetical protein